MILRKLTIENFGAYGGRQTADLTPRSNRPVVLFGGMNGEGKTTLLDAIQLAFYGSRATLSNRGRLAYRDYLRESIHRGATDAGSTSSVELEFSRTVEGVVRKYQLVRQWYFAPEKGVVETVSLSIDGRFDQEATDHWDEEIEAFLPSGIAHLFFFDGEQVKELAEGGHAAEIVGTAMRSLLGLDIVDRLESDLRVFERRKRAESLGAEDTLRLDALRIELQALDDRQRDALMAEGAIRNELGRLELEVANAKEQFRKAGGEQFVRRSDLEVALAKARVQQSGVADQLRTSIAGPLPLVAVSSLLRQAEEHASEGQEVVTARMLLGALETRDAEMVKRLQHSAVAAAAVRELEKVLDQDRSDRKALTDRPVLIEPSSTLLARLRELRANVIPEESKHAKSLRADFDRTAIEMQRIEAELARVPSEESLADSQLKLTESLSALQQKSGELEAIELRLETYRRQRISLEGGIDRLGLEGLEARISDDDRKRMLRHSAKVRDTLGRLRIAVIARHARRIEELMLDCFQQLLRKPDLVTELRIDPETFEPKLFGQHGHPLPIDRLSAGERQLLATAMLWGLARASGRPIPAIIDTPLGRLDSAHRKNLIERYFPNASHQVVLLSTDEEIVGAYHEKLKKHVSRSYLLTRDKRKGCTNIVSGYFQ